MIENKEIVCSARKRKNGLCVMGCTKLGGSSMEGGTKAAEKSSNEKESGGRWGKAG